MTRQQLAMLCVVWTIAPYFLLETGLWVAAVLSWDPETGIFETAEETGGCSDYGAAVEAAQPLARRMAPAETLS